MAISKKEGRMDMESLKREQKRYRNSLMAGREGNTSVSPKSVKSATDGVYTNGGDGNDGSRGTSFDCKEGYNKETVRKYSKTEEAVTSLIKFRIIIRVNLNRIINFFKQTHKWKEKEYLHQNRKISS